MKSNLFGLLLFASILISCNQNSVQTSSPTEETIVSVQKDKITLKDIWMSNTFSQEGVWGINPMNEPLTYAKIERGYYPSIVQYDITSGEKIKTIFDGEQHSLKFDSYEFNDDETKVLLATNTESIYRRSTKADYYIYDLATNTLSKLTDGVKQTYPQFSPDNSKIAYIQSNNLYVKNFSTNQTTAITTNGEWNSIINGMSDWVYEEEFMLTRAFEWSPNSEKLAYFSFDESNVKEFSMDIYGELYPSQYKFKYPKAGEDNSIVSTYVYHLPTQTNSEINLGKKDDVYFPRMKWTKNNELIVFKMNRHQNELELLKVNEQTRSGNLLLKEENKYYVSEDVLDEMEFLPNGNFLWTSERDGYKHIYLYDEQGKLVQQLTKGDYDVTTLYGYDETTNAIYYQAAEISPLERQIYKLNIDGSGKTLLTDFEGWNSAKFSKNFEYFIHTNSTSSSPNIITVRNSEGNSIRELVNNKELKEKVEQLNLPQKEFIQFTANDGQLLNAWIMKPTNFDESTQYPVLMFVYGGPGSQTVQNSWRSANDWWHTFMAEQGYIVVSVDNRGTGARGQEFKKMTYQELGKYEVEDQIAAAKQLGEMPFINKERIGIWGWSYGGYMSSLALLKGNDVFSTAIAVAPVTNWRYYDTIYTERYMRTPQENPTGYDDNSPINHVDKLKGDFLLVHGMADDNVHFQNAVDLVDALNKAGKQYDLAIYPNKNHGIYGGNTRYQLFEKMTNFILETL